MWRHFMTHDIISSNMENAFQIIDFSLPILNRWFPISLKFRLWLNRGLVQSLAREN